MKTIKWPAIFSEIKEAIASAFAEPDPLRFAHLSTYPANWNGELEGKQSRKGGAILVDEVRSVWEFGEYANVKIEDYLTAIDIQELRARKLNPDNPAYSKCKQYFSKNPFCTESDMAAVSAGDQSKGEYFAGVSPNTCEKVLAAFRAYLVDKPTF